MTAIWTSANLAIALNTNFDFAVSASGIAIDSRNVTPGDVFIAITGVNNDGHNYIEQAFKNGALCCIVDKKVNIKGNIINVADSFAALEQLANFNRQNTKAVFIAITGSVGKTSTREMLKLAFSDQFATYASNNNYNNHYGVPLTLANMPRNTECAIIELGMSAVGEIAKLSKMVKPDIAIITAVGPAHLQNFSSVAAIAAAKAEIFEGLVLYGSAIIDADTPYYAILEEQALKKKTKILSFGYSEKADAILLNYQIQEKNSLITTQLNGYIYNYEMSCLGKHLAKNSLIVLMVSHLMRADMNYSMYTMKQFTALKGRGRVINLANNVTIIDDSYNANPASMGAALQNLANYQQNRTIAILGDMLELGKASEQLHRELLDKINNISIVHTVGQQMSNLYKLLPENCKGQHYENANKAMENIKQKIRPHDVVLVKGSFAMKMYNIINHIV